MTRSSHPSAPGAAALPALAALFLLAVAAPAPAITRTSIRIDGSMADWAVVLRDDRNYVEDRVAAGGDPDQVRNQISGERDMRLLAATWDAERVYVYLRRTERGSSNISYFLYLDLDDDRRLGAGDRVVELRFNGGAFNPPARLSGYAPAAPPSDPLEPDGTPQPGAPLAPADALDVEARLSSDELQIEASLPWSALFGRPAPVCPDPAVAGCPPLNLRAASGTNGREDTTGLLTTRYDRLTLAAGATRRVAGGSPVDFAHTVCNVGNVVVTANFDVVPATPWPLELRDGACAAALPSTDPPDPRPDSGPLAPGACFDLCLHVEVLGLPGDPDPYLLQVDANTGPDVFARNFDTIAWGALVLEPDRQKLGLPGALVLYPHRACNFSGRDGSIALALSSPGWPGADVWSDPDGDGDPADGAPIAALAVADGTCGSLVVRVPVPAAAPLGTPEGTLLTATLGAATDRVTDTTTPAEAIAFVQDLSDRAGAGTSAFFPARLTNATGLTASYRLSHATLCSDPGGSPLDPQPDVRVLFWSDPDGDGTLDDGQPITVAGPAAASGGTTSLVTQVAVPPEATASMSCATTVRAALVVLGASAQVVDTTVVQSLITYGNASFLRPTDVFPPCIRVHVKGFSVEARREFHFRFTPPAGADRFVPPLLASPNSIESDALFEVSGSMWVSVPPADPMGLWAVEAEQKQGGSFAPLVPERLTTTFVVRNVLGGEGSFLSGLVTIPASYPVGDVVFAVAAVLENQTSITLEAPNRMEYLAFRDDDGDGRPSAGELYIDRLGGVRAWDPAAPGFTCETRDVATLQPGDRINDNHCASGLPVRFGAGEQGLWTVCATWTGQECGAVFAGECTPFTVGCSGTLALADPAGPDRSICAGDSVRLGDPGAPGAGHIYEWTPPTFLDDPRAQQPVATPVATAPCPPGNEPCIVYSLRVIRTADLCGQDDAVTVTVSPRPVGRAGPDVTVCGAAGVRIGQAPPAQAPPITCRWSPAAGLSSASACQPIATPSTTTVYTVTWTDPASGCGSRPDDSSSVVVTAGPVPVADAGADVEVCPGSPPVRIGTPALPGYLYGWLPVAGLSDAGVAQPVVAPAADRTYALTVTDLVSGCEGRDTVRVFCAAVPRILDLLRNDSVTALAPLAPSRASLFPGNRCAGSTRGTVTALDPEGADCTAGLGEGALQALPGSSDDDDLYRDPPLAEPEAGVVEDAGRPLVLYEVEDDAAVGGEVLRLAKGAVGANPIAVCYPDVSPGRCN